MSVMQPELGQRRARGGQGCRMAPHATLGSYAVVGVGGWLVGRVAGGGGAARGPMQLQVSRVALLASCSWTSQAPGLLLLGGRTIPRPLRRSKVFCPGDRPVHTHGGLAALVAAGFWGCFPGERVGPARLCCVLVFRPRPTALGCLPSRRIRHFRFDLAVGFILFPP